MIEPQSPLINIDQSEGRARHIGRVEAEPRGQPFRKDRLTRAQVPAQEEDRPAPKPLSHAATDLERLLLRAGDRLLRGNRIRLCRIFNHALSEIPLDYSDAFTQGRSPSPPASMNACPRFSVMSEAIIARTPAR